MAVALGTSAQLISVGNAEEQVHAAKFTPWLTGYFPGSSNTLLLLPVTPTPLSPVLSGLSEESLSVFHYNSLAAH